MMADEYDPTNGPARVLLGTDTKTRAPVYLPYAARDLGVALIGKAGTGKSSLLEHMILADLEVGTPGMVIDPHGLLAQRVMELATPEQAERIILLEAVRNAPFGLNLLAVRDPVDDNDDPVSWAADSVVATIKKLYGESDEFLPRLERYLDLSARTLILSKLTLLDAPRLFEDTSFRQNCLGKVTDPQEQQSLRRSWAAYDKLRPGEQITHTEALVNRLERLLAPPVIRGIVGSRETTVPFNEILNGDKMLIVSLPSDRLSPERCDFIGAMLLCALADRIFARDIFSAKFAPRLHLYLDKYQRFATVTTAELLEQGRKYNAGVTLAHQTLYQIQDQRIRNAARHAGTLIVLGVTRPDAEQLAGEFPIEPQEEWVETIEEIDGTEPKYVFSPTPAEDVYVEKHSSADVDLAARTLFKYYPPHERTEQVVSNHQPEPQIPQRSRQYMGQTFIEPRRLSAPKMDKRYIPDDKRKSAGVRPRPGGAPFPEHLKLIAPELNRLLSDAQEGKLVTPEDGADALLATGIFAFRWNREAWLAIEAMGSSFEETEANYARFLKVYKLECDEFLQACVRPWLITHLANPENLLGGDYPFNLKWADSLFAKEAFERGWDQEFSWSGTIDTETWRTRRRPPKLRTIINIDDPAMLRMLAARRQQLRWIWILCEGLRREPAMMRSLDHQPRITKRHIVHGGQTHADALNEFAGRLVFPSKRYVAQVRQPQEYHEVKLRAPLEGGAGAGDRLPDPYQPDDIRTRSRALYDTSPCEEIVAPPLSIEPEQPQQRRVTRRPRPQDPE
jgi:hypothetical protein